MIDETIRTSMSRVIEDQSAPVGVRELALEVLRWRLRDRVPAVDAQAAPDDKGRA